MSSVCLIELPQTKILTFVVASRIILLDGESCRVVAEAVNGRRCVLLPKEGGDVYTMQYVTYENLFQFSLVIIGIIGLFVMSLDRYNKKK